MGQAKQRGTFEERKAQAIEAGRLKKRIFSLDYQEFQSRQFMRAFCLNLFSRRNG